MWMLLLGLTMIIAFPFSRLLFFSPTHPNPLFLFAHESLTHLGVNLFSLMLVWLVSKKTGTRQKRLLFSFFSASFATLLFSLMFDLPIIGASVGIYGMIGYLIPEMIDKIPLHWSYSVLSLVIMFDGAINVRVWEKLFHFFGLTFGVVLRYMTDAKQMSLIKQMKSMGLGFDTYSSLGAAYPTRTTIRYHYSN